MRFGPVTVLTRLGEPRQGRAGGAISARSVFTVIAWLFFAASAVFMIFVVQAGIEGKVTSHNRHVPTTYTREADPWMFRFTLILNGVGAVVPAVLGAIILHFARKER